MIRIGTGHSDHADGFKAAESVAESALRSGLITRPDLVVAFCPGPLDHDAFLQGLQQKVGKSVPIIGGSSIGIITNGYISYRGTPSGAAIIQGDDCTFRVASSSGLDKGETPTGTSLARKLRLNDQDKLLLTFYDSVRRPATPNSPPALNASAPLLEGLTKELNEEIPIVGAGLIGDYAFGATRQF
ncbi:MAG TPA: FIST N-terminal domain-containing protein, partial [Thermodesulfovibrionales bacterium]|nr:FIST N-terminal domain-containing protein [Thermodesulfovibrionales bacterium]